MMRDDDDDEDDYLLLLPYYWNRYLKKKKKKEMDITGRNRERKDGTKMNIYLPGAHIYTYTRRHNYAYIGEGARRQINN